MAATKRIIAIDPGITTGMAFRFPFPDGLATCHSTSEDEILSMLVKGTDIVVVERFATSGRISAPGLHTVELVGAIRGWCKALGIQWVRHVPQTRYDSMPLAKAQVGGIIKPGPLAKHEVDALAHLLSYESSVGLGPYPEDDLASIAARPRPVRSGGGRKRVDPRGRLQRLREHYGD